MLAAKTAIVRSKFSKPLRLAIEREIVTSNTTVLDFGCGRGDDVRLLQERGIKATGYDPIWQPELPQERPDVVLLTYVLNVIQNLKDRELALKTAFLLARKALVVSVRTDFDSFKTCKQLDDGFLTSKGTFQRPYHAKEFCAFVKETLMRGVRADVLASREIQQLASGVVLVGVKW